MKRLRGLFFSTLRLGFLSAVLVVLPSPAEYLSFSFPADRFDYSTKHVVENKRSQILWVEVVPRGETVEAWTEMLTIQSFGRKKYMSPEEAVEKTKRDLEARCQSLTWQEIARQPNDITYEWRIENCPPNSDQHEVARYVASKYNVFRVAYTLKAKQLTPEERQKWIALFQSAKIQK